MGSIVCLPRPEWLETAGEYFQTDEYRQNPDYCRILAWKNKTTRNIV